jgi:hypothetical protein
MRLACLYALLDRSPVVRAPHLLAALALWDYCQASGRFIFGDAMGDTSADKLLTALRAAANGLSKTEISKDVFNKNKSAGDIAALLSKLFTARAIHRKQDHSTGGRPAERWYAGRGPQ